MGVERQTIIQKKHTRKLFGKQFQETRHTPGLKIKVFKAGECLNTLA